MDSVLPGFLTDLAKGGPGWILFILTAFLGGLTIRYLFNKLIECKEAAVKLHEEFNKALLAQHEAFTIAREAMHDKNIELTKLIAGAQKAVGEALGELTQSIRERTVTFDASNQLHTAVAQELREFKRDYGQNQGRWVERLTELMKDVEEILQNQRDVKAALTRREGP